MQTWITELKQLGPQNIVLAIAGNKSDLEDQRRVWKCVDFYLVGGAHVPSREYGDMIS